MYARLTLQAIGPGRPCFRIIAHQCKRARPNRFYSSQGIDDKNEKHRQAELRATDRGDSIPSNAPRQDGPISNPQDAANTKNVTATQQEEADLPREWPSTPAQSPPVDEIRRHGLGGVQANAAAAEDDERQNMYNDDMGYEEDVEREEIRLAGQSDEPEDYVSAEEAGGGHSIQGRNDDQYYAAEGSEQAEEFDDEDEVDEDEQDEEEQLSDEELEDLEEMEEAEPTLQQELVYLEDYNREEVTPVAFDPAKTTREAYLQSGRGGTTITANNGEGVIVDRVQQLTEMRQENFRYAPYFARSMMRGKLVSFNSEEERDEVVKEARKYAYNIGRSASAVRKGLGEEVKTEHGFAPVGEKMGKDLVDRYVRGKYVDPQFLKSGKTRRKDMGRQTFKGGELADHITRNLMRNGTYLDRDVSKMLKKVQSLVPRQAKTPARPVTNK